MHHVNRTNAVLVLVSLFLSSAVLAEEKKAKPVMILDSLMKTSFRYFEVTATDVAKTKEGKLVRVNAIIPAEAKDKKSGEWKPILSIYQSHHTGGEKRLRPAKRITHTPLPGTAWVTTEFDDSQWARVGPAGRIHNGKVVGAVHHTYHAWGPMQYYRSIAMMCVRSGFTVVEPDQVGELKLHLQFRGGVVVYLNGQEVGRAHMPEGEVKWDTLAEDYPKEAFINAKGEFILDQKAPYANWRTVKRTPELAPRMRITKITIPADKLIKGRNVLALSLHRTSAPEGMFIQRKYNAQGRAYRGFWNRVSLESLKLSASGAAEGSVLPNAGAPAKMTVANLPVTDEISVGMKLDAGEKAGPVKVAGVANGAHAGMALVNCKSPLKNLKASVTALKGREAVIPAKNIEIGYQNLDGYRRTFGTIDSDAPAMIDIFKLRGFRGRIDIVPYVSKPIWFVVNIPKHTKAGIYKGEITVSADDQETIKFPLELEVLGAWQMPKSTDFRTFTVFISSPETLALHYEVPLWSEEHWKLCEESLRLLGQLGNKEVLITFTPKTYVGNEHAMLRFIKGKDGKLKADFSIVDRYIGLAAKHMGSIPSICTIFNYGGGPRYAGEDKGKQYITIYDPETKTLTDCKDIPQWGTPEALTFWKPVTDEYLAILKKHKVGPSPVMYWSQFCGVNWGSWRDLKKLMPGLQHMNRTHIGSERGRREIGKSRLYCAVVASNGPGVYWDPDFHKPSYGWRHKVNILTAARHGLLGKNWRGHSPSPSHYRIIPEQSLLTGLGRGRILRAGFGQYGADFWSIMHKVKKTKGVKNQYGVKTLTGRYSPEGGAGMVGMSSILGPGRKQPCPTGKFQLIREGLQEAEARMYVIDAILDQPDKLGPDLLKRAKDITDNHTRLLRFFSDFFYHGKQAPQVLQKKAREMYLLAGEVQRALRSNRRVSSVD